MTDPLANAFPGDANKGDMESIQKLKSAYDTLKKEMHRVIVGQERGRRRAADLHLLPGATPPGRRARPGQDAA